MLEPVGTLLIHMSPALVMGTLLLFNLGARSQRDARRAAEDQRRIAAALAAELAALCDALNENLDLIAAGSPFLVSTRQAGAVYRGTLARIVAGLDEAALPVVVAAFAYQQRLESYVAACTKPNGGHGVTILPRLTPLQELKRRYAEGLLAAEQALAALAPPQPAMPVAAAGTRRWSWRREACAAPAA